MPSTAIGDVARAASVSSSPAGPKSRPWLLAIDTASTPAPARATRALAGARNVYFFGCGVPCSVREVSRFTTVRSAPEKRLSSGASMPAPSAFKRLRRLASKWVSPPKPMVTGCPLPLGPRGVVVATPAAEDA